MQKTTRLFLLAGVLGLAVMLAVGMGVLTASKASGAKQAAPIAAPLNLDPALMVGDPLAPTCGDLVGGERTCDLWATTGEITMPTGEVVPIWGFTDLEGTPAQLPGPVIVANQGEILHIVLHNQLLTETVSLFFVGQEGFVPDLLGTSDQSAYHYRVTLTKPGTFLYQAGLTGNGARQVAMGMYGGLIVRPSADPASAYGTAADAFTKEALLIYSEIDPDFNNNPSGFNMQDFKPEFWLINGKAYPQTEWIGAAAGETVLLRQANAGLEQKSIGLLGIEQKFIAVDGEPLLHPYTMVAESIGTGQTIDTLVTVPATTVTDMVFPLYESSMHQHNGGSYLDSGQLAFGGILSFLGVTSGAAPVEPGPIVTSFTVNPDDTNATTDLALTGAITVQGTGSTVEAYEISIALPDGSTQTLPPVTVSGASVSVNETIPMSTMGTWPGGTVIFYLRGQDNLGVWGQPGSAVLNFDIVGPEIYGLKLSPNPTNGLVDVHLSGTASERWTGNEFVTESYASFQGVDIPLTPNHEGVVVGLSGDIPAAQIAALPEGQYPVSVWAADFHGNIGDPVSVTLTVDKTGPAASNVTLTPNTLNFSVPLNVTNVRLDATVTDPESSGISTPLYKVWAYFDDPANKFEVFPADGMFDTTSEAVYFNIPVTNFARLGTGIHYVYVIGQDKAGNMGVGVGGSIEVLIPEADNFGPELSNLAVSPNPTVGANTVTLTGRVVDPSLVAYVEWFRGADPGFGSGDPVVLTPVGGDYVEVTFSESINIANWPNGTNIINVRAKDAVDNWSSTYQVVLEKTRRNQGIVLVESFEDPTLTQWDEVVGAVSLVTEAQMPAAGTFAVAAVDLGMKAEFINGEPAYVQDNLENLTGYQISFYFDPNSVVMGGGKHQIFAGSNSEASPLFGIELDEGPAGYLVRAWVATAEGIKYTPDFDLSDAPHKFELIWNPSADAILVFSFDDADFVVPSTSETASISGVEASGGKLYEVRLGPSAVESGADPQGAEYFDSINVVPQQTMFLYLPLITH